MFAILAFFYYAAILYSWFTGIKIIHITDIPTYNLLLIANSFMILHYVRNK